MSLYYYVENNSIIEGPKNLPSAWKNISGLNRLDNADLAKLGWLPETRIGFEPFNPLTQTRTGPTLTVNQTDVTAAYVVSDKSTQQMDNEKDVNAENDLNTSFNKTLFDVLYDLESRIRVIESKPSITKVQYRNALKNIYKSF